MDVKAKDGLKGENKTTHDDALRYDDALRSDHRAEISRNIVWYDAMALRPERNGVLTAVIQDQHPENGKKKPLITLCATRWVARIEAYDHFYASFKYTVFALEVIAHNMHHDECPEQFYGCWQTKTRIDASGLLKTITDFDFIVTFICAYSCLSHMSEEDKRYLQSFFDGYGGQGNLQRLRANLPTHFDEIYDQAVTMAEKVGVAPTAPRIAERQRHRANAPAVDPKEHYRVNVAVPFFDHIISELDDQFSSLTLRVSKLLGLVPSVIQESRVTAQQLTDLVDLYKDDLPSPQLFSSEFQRWKIMVQNGRIAADSCASSLKALKAAAMSINALAEINPSLRELLQC
ncbi:52 kDa repressor of the inhibitor of the protein kinase [Acropora cervicornis]|uniref:52 kDa repressor of the inhibitor of the protein kinase n=1 Tax=Acropora cervicornis TaxID=6130 RepID=A0AAD9QRD3_ACRCE|nr:52 kDa repressor of the inhibitor of the protein kinase [Acropora cervicornis]